MGSSLKKLTNQNYPVSRDLYFHFMIFIAENNDSHRYVELTRRLNFVCCVLICLCQPYSRSPHLILWILRQCRFEISSFSYSVVT